MNAILYTSGDTTSQELTPEESKIFDEADFYLEEGDKVGIVGINGTGKSTLLKIIAGLEEADQGQVIRANHVVISYLKQQPDFLEKETVME